jgi:hypothetical protein
MYHTKKPTDQVEVSSVPHPKKEKQQNIGVDKVGGVDKIVRI